MAIVSIIADDDVIVVDGDARTVDLSALRAVGIHAVQWDGSAGFVEYDRRNADFGRATRPIGNLGAFQAYRDAWADAPALDTPEDGRAAVRNARQLAIEAVLERFAALPNPPDAVTDYLTLRDA